MYNFVCSSISFAHELLFKLIAHVLHKISNLLYARSFLLCNSNDGGNGMGGRGKPEKKSQRWQHLFAVFLLHDDEDDGREQWVRMYMDEDRRRTKGTNIGLK